MKNLYVFLLVILFGLTGCVDLPVAAKVQAKPFSDDDYKPYTASGKSSLRGQIFGLTVGGDVKYGAGKFVFLYPATDYGIKQKNCWLAEYGCAVVSGDEAMHKKFMKVAQADAGGNYVFANLPAGKYVVLSRLTWEYPGRYGMQTTGGNIGAEVEITNDEDKTLQLKL
jgi:hypothetical protein